MPKARWKAAKLGVGEDFPIAAANRRKAIPHEFVLEALAALSPITRPMFGCLAIYVTGKIVGVLRDRPTAPADNGFWLATTREHHASLRDEFPSMRSIGVLGEDVTGWQILPVDAVDFEQSAMRACELIIARDPRIGKVPKPKRSRAKLGMGSGKKKSQARRAESSKASKLKAGRSSSGKSSTARSGSRKSARRK